MTILDNKILLLTNIYTGAICEFPVITKQALKLINATNTSQLWHWIHDNLDHKNALLINELWSALVHEFGYAEFTLHKQVRKYT